MENIYDKIQESAKFIESKSEVKPSIGLILGSGLGVLADEIQNPVKIKYNEIPNFPVSTVEGHEGCLVLGELEGKIIAGNDFNYVRTHAMAIMTTGNYSIVSSSAKAIEAGLVSLSGISLIDMAFGLQRSYDGLTYKTFTPQLSSLMKSFTQAGGSLLVSGSYITSDQTSNAERQAVRELLHCDYGRS